MFTSNEKQRIDLSQQALEPDCTEFLSVLLRSFDVDSVDAKQRTLLHHAAMFGHAKAVEILLREKADTNARDVDGSTPLHLAAQNDMVSSINLLLKSKHHQTDPNAVDHRHGRTPLHYAVGNGHFAACKALFNHSITDVNAVDMNQQTPLFVSILYNRTDISEALIKDRRTSLNQVCRYDVSLLDDIKSYQISPFFTSASNETIPAFLAALLNRTEVLQQFLDIDRFDPNFVFEDLSLIYVAISLFEEDLVQLLLNHPRIDVNLRTREGRTPLHFAVGHNSLSKLTFPTIFLDGPFSTSTFEHFCEVSPLRKDFNSVECFRSRYRDSGDEIINLLIGSDRVEVNSKNESGDTALHTVLALEKNNEALLAFLNAPSVKVNSLNANGLSVLQVAIISAFHMDRETHYLDSILACDRVEIDVVDPYQQTVLHLAAKYGICSSLRTLLRDVRFDVNASDKYGNSPLHAACSSKSITSEYYRDLCVEMILRCDRVDVNKRNGDGNAPIHVANARLHEIFLKYDTVDWNVLNEHGETLIHMLARDLTYPESLLKSMLISGRVDFHKKDKDGNTAVICGKTYPDVVQMLLDGDYKIGTHKNVESKVDEDELGMHENAEAEVDEEKLGVHENVKAKVEGDRPRNKTSFLRSMRARLTKKIRGGKK